MKKHLVWMSILLLWVVSAPLAAQDTPPESPLLQMLHFVADNTTNRQWLTYGDMAAWDKSWNVPRINNIAELNNLSKDQRAYWLYIAATQTVVPEPLGINYVSVDDMRGAYGFDMFNIDRFLQAGNPPNGITVVDFSFDKTQIANALTASKYTSQTLDSGAILYSIRNDYEIDLSSSTHVGQLANLNRIALMDGQMVIGNATTPVTSAISAFQGKTSSLADEPSYVAAVKSLDDPALVDTGDLVGVIMMDHSNFDVSSIVISPTSEAIDQMLQGYSAVPLPAYNLVAFATRHGNGATHLILEVVFPEGTDAKSAANVLADRMKNYISLSTHEPLSDRWTFETAAGTKIGGLPVALVVMKVDDPLPTPEGQDLPNARVLSWLQMVERRDVAYLISQP